MMQKVKLSYQDTNSFSKTVIDYIANDEKLQPFLGNYPNIAGFDQQIALKKKNTLTNSQRKTLVNALNEQYKNTVTSVKTQVNITLLADENTFTITTGHQLNLFTGPLYFLYKIISTINLTKQLKQTFPEYNFVPIYWMASEDHDFEEIRYFNYKNNKIQWEKDAQGAVGRLGTKGLDASFETFKKVLEASPYSDELLALFNKSYLNSDNLAIATFTLANELFKDYGLVILDADNKDLKSLFKPYIHKELEAQLCYNTVSKTIAKLKPNYKIQVNPREINLFYLKDGLRERIIYKDEKYFINNTAIAFSPAEIQVELEHFPERFSPNVLMRPLYQEVILPNLCYIGGGGELAYWLELKAYFDANAVVFPIYLLRNSALLITAKQEQQMKKLNLTYKDLFLNTESLVKKKVKEKSTNPIDFEALRETLQKQFKLLEANIKNTDQSFSGAVSAEQKRQMNSLDKLEKRFYKAEKIRLTAEVVKIRALKNKLFPNGSLQERKQNFSVIYELIGAEIIPSLAKELEPLDLSFSILTV